MYKQHLLCNVLIRFNKIATWRINYKWQPIKNKYRYENHPNLNVPVIWKTTFQTKVIMVQM